VILLQADFSIGFDNDGSKQSHGGMGLGGVADPGGRTPHLVLRHFTQKASRPTTTVVDRRRLSVLSILEAFVHARSPVAAIVEAKVELAVAFRRLIPRAPVLPVIRRISSRLASCSTIEASARASKALSIDEKSDSGGIDEVRAHYVGAHPGLNNASYEEEITDTAHKVRFTSAVGTRASRNQCRGGLVAQ
jgi:hypothetical protein